MSFSDHFPTVVWLLKHWSRILAYAALAVVGFAVATVAALHVDQYIVRSRAVRLQSGIQELMVGKTTPAEAREVFRASGLDSQVVENRTGDSISEFNIDLSGPLFRRIATLLAADPLREQRFAHACLQMNVHLSLIRAWVIFRDGVVSEKGLSFVIASPSEGEYDRWVQGSVGVAPELRSRRFERAFPKKELQAHPQYIVLHDKGVTRGAGYSVELDSISLEFTPFTARADLDRLTQTNLDCLTRWRPCRTVADLMPEAWRQFKEDLGSSKENPPGFTYK